MKKRKLIREEISYLDFLNNNFTVEKYSITPLKDFNHIKAHSMFGDGNIYSLEANEPIKSTYRASILGDILISQFPEFKNQPPSKELHPLHLASHIASEWIRSKK